MQFVLKTVMGRPAMMAAAVLVTALVMSGCGTSMSANNVTATPAFSPAGGSYNTSQAVTITEATKGAVLYCTTDGTTPTTASPQCSQPTTVFKSEFLQAIAVAPGMTASAAASAGYTIDLTAAATPTFSPAGGGYPAGQTVTLADATPGVNIFYTLDGSAPTASSMLYTGPITVTQPETINVVAVASGFGNSAIASAAYTIGAGGTPPSGGTPGTTATPTFSVAGGTFSSAQTVTLADATSGAMIFYTVDGSAPSASSTTYANPIPVAQSETIKAIAIAAGSSSAVASASYTISLGSTTPPPTGSAGTPTISPAAGSYTSTQTVTITVSGGGSIYYTTNGNTTDISANGTLYGGPITVSQSETINAIAVPAGGGAPGPVASASYSIFPNGIPAPTVLPAGGTFGVAQMVTLSDSASGANLYYTLDGTIPTATSPQYSGPIAVSATETINAIAIANSNSSAVAKATYTILTGAQTLSGKVLSGLLPVVGAQVQFYGAGQTGYGSAPAALLAAPVTTDSNGAFTFPYTCPASPNDLVYLVATGGSAGAGANAGLELISALGPCGTLVTLSSVVMNEATTVASAYALSPFMTTAPNVGSTSTNYSGLTNAFLTVSNLVNLTTGQALTITPAYATNAVPFLNSSTVPQSRIDTMADILNGCVNSNGAGGGCSNLYIQTTPNGGSAPTNTLQAILNIAQNPGTSVASLFGLASPTGPFQPELTAAPADWTMALTFTGAGLGFAPGTTISLNGNNGSPATNNTALAVDASGNIWVTALNRLFGGSMVAEFNSLGAPVTPASTVNPAPAPPVTYGGYFDPSIQATGPSSLAFDQTGNLWLGAGGSTEISEIATNMSPNLTVKQAGIFVWPQAPLTLSIDAAANVWVGGGGLGGFLGGLDEYDNNGNEVAPSFGFVGQSAANPNGYNTLSQLIFDSNANLWGEDQGNLDLINQTDGTITSDPFFATGGAATPLVADGAGNIYGCGALGGQTLGVLSASSSSITNTFPITTGRGCGGQMAIDGLGHLFAVSGGTAPGIIDEFTTAGVLISPATTGYTGTSKMEAPTINPDPSLVSPPQTLPITTGVSGAAIDGSGNLWVLNGDTGTTASPGNVLVEFVGIAAPVVTPTSLAVANGQTGSRP